MSSLLALLNEAQRQEYYLDCARVALAHYALGSVSIHFVQHNAEMVYRLDDAAGEARLDQAVAQLADTLSRVLG
jgi:hypothetical protein